MMVNFVPGGQFYTNETCKSCQGKKYSLQHEQCLVNGLSIGDFMTTPFERLLTYIEKIIDDIADANLLFAINNIHR